MKGSAMVKRIESGQGAGGAVVVTVGGEATPPSTAGTPPSSPSAIPPAASASGPRMTGCDCPTSGNGIGCEEPAKSTEGWAPLFGAA